MLHTYMPILVFLEWLLTRTALPLKIKTSFWVLVYPLAWLTFAITRGYITGWWAYWFIDPQYAYATMAQWILTIAAFFTVLGVVLLPARMELTWSSRIRK
jgi:hypothetical protein